MKFDTAAIKRLIACVFGGFLLCLMVGTQEGSQNDFGQSFHQATSFGRLLVFLLLGVLAFFLLASWQQVKPLIRLPGAVTVFTGFVFAGAGMTLMKWYDQIGKFGKVSTAVSHSGGAPALVKFYFSEVGWVLLVVGLILGGAAVAARRKIVAYALTAYGAIFGVLIFIAHHQLVNFGGRIDHSLGVFATVAGYFTLAVAGIVVARSDTDVGDPRGSVERALSWRPGLPIAGIAVVLGLLAYLDTAWFAPLKLDAHFHKTSLDFHGYGLAALASTYMSWLGPTLFAIAAVVVIVSCVRCVPWLAAIGAAAALAGVILTFITLHQLSQTGVKANPAYGETWQNLGAGGWVACLGFSFLLGAAILAIQAQHIPRKTPTAISSDQAGAATGRGGSAINRTIILVSLAIVLFYPPTLPLDWQNVVTTQIAAYLLLAVGLNVVVGWAGLLDLGYIAFFGIGSYATAYFTSSLPRKPPEWLHFSPLWVIIFAVIACLIAGVLLGAPTLRLRGDYLAIVTLGFGEIIQIIAINNPGNFTGGPIGPEVPQPVLHVPHTGIHITWGLDSLPYWYLLLALLGITMLLFHRLENSRTGRAWAAIREDEVAAQATGIRTMRAKLLAFAIGASTSGVAGVFFASQNGYFDPSDFTIQTSILIVAYVVFGGMGSLAGAVAGAAVLTWLPYFLQSQVPLPDSQMWIGAVVMIMMIFRPAGLIPARRRRAELAGLHRTDSAEVSAVPAAGAL